MWDGPRSEITPIVFWGQPAWDSWMANTKSRYRRRDGGRLARLQAERNKGREWVWVCQGKATSTVTLTVSAMRPESRVPECQSRPQSTVQSRGRGVQD